MKTRWPEPRWSLTEHLEEAVEWLKDHADFKTVAGVIFTCGLLIFIVLHADDCSEIWATCTAYFAQLGMFATVPVVFMCISSIILGVPVDFVLLWSGAFFGGTYGPVTGTALGVASGCVGVYSGCLIAFVLGRTVFKPKVEKYMEEFAMLRNINAIIEADGWKFALVMRLSPLIPNEPLNYACAMTSMSLKHMAISLLGCFPKTAYEVWLAAQASSSLSSRGHSRGHSSLVIGLNIAISLLMLALCIAAKRRYDDYVNSTEAIPELHKRTMVRRGSLIGFDAELKRKTFMGAKQPLLETESGRPHAETL